MCAEMATELKFALRLHDPVAATVTYAQQRGDANGDHLHNRYGNDLDKALAQCALKDSLLKVCTPIESRHACWLIEPASVPNGYATCIATREH